MEPIEVALRRREAYPPPEPPHIDVFETHVSLVFVAGGRVYKVKKPVKFPFLDYSTLEKRKRFCEEEVRLNRRLAPDVYRGVVPITADGRVGGKGEPVEYAIEMARLPHDRMLDEMLRKGAVTAADVERIADIVASFHAGAERHAASSIEQIRKTFDDAAPFLRPAWLARLRADHERVRAELLSLLERRAADGFVRDGHGDLHAGNVCLPDGDVVIYDCIEFDPAFRIGDVAAEIAFLAMDLERYGAWDLSAAFVRRYVGKSGDGGTESLLPLFKPYRACVRGLVESLRGLPTAGDYFRLAVSYGLPPFVVLVSGLPGTGKSHFAREAARAFGAEHLRSDVIRKEMLGIAPTKRWAGGHQEGPYAPDVTERTYAEMDARVRTLLRSGRRVIVDATFARRRWRDELRAAAREAGARCLSVHVTCAEDVVRSRMEKRAHDRAEVSDADYGVYRKAKETFETPSTPDASHESTAPTAPTLDLLLDRLLGNG